jgi:hypothetical protein
MYLAIELLEPVFIGSPGVSPWILLAGFVVFGIFVYAGASLVLNRRAFHDVIGTGRSIFRGRGPAAGRDGIEE